MKFAVEKATEAALIYWRTGEVSTAWQEQGWTVQAQVADEDGLLHVGLVGPPGSGLEGIALRVFPRDYGRETPSRSPGRVSRLPPESKQALIDFAFCKLFWPGPRHTALWAKTQIAVYLLQRSGADQDKAWVWNELVVRTIRLPRGGREALDSGEIGYETLDAIVRNYINPSGPGGFQSYIRHIVDRIATQAQKTRFAETAEDADARVQDERFQAFVRQRKKRGEPGLFLRGGRISATDEKWQELAERWGRSVGRKRMTNAIADAMVNLGATRGSATRQVRRWFQQCELPADVQERFVQWRERRRDDK